MTDYTVRRSPRARHVWLRFDREGQLVIVVPHRFDLRRVPAIVESHAGWIERAKNRIKTRRQRVQQEQIPSLPDNIVLPAIGRAWKVEYLPTASPRMTVLERDGTLTVCGPVEDTARCRRTLLRWLRRAGHAYLAELTASIASSNGFKPGTIVIRAQRTRWASCSRRGTLSLNVRLLFIAPELARHVLVHELCHTKHMDHSQKFWACVALHDAEWKDHRRRLRAAWRDVPGWLDAECVRRIRE